MGISLTTVCSAVALNVTHITSVVSASSVHRLDTTEGVFLV